MPAHVEEQWPDLPLLFQQAMNSSHGVAKDMGEMEVMATIAQHYQHFHKEGDPKAMEKAVELAGQSQTRCHAYMHTLAHYISHYAGDEFCLVYFLETFSALANETIISFSLWLMHCFFVAAHGLASSLWGMRFCAKPRQAILSVCDAGAGVLPFCDLC